MQRRGRRGERAGREGGRKGATGTVRRCAEGVREGLGARRGGGGDAAELWGPRGWAVAALTARVMEDGTSRQTALFLVCAALLQPPRGWRYEQCT